MIIFQKRRIDESIAKSFDIKSKPRKVNKTKSSIYNNNNAKGFYYKYLNQKQQNQQVKHLDL